MNISYAVFYLLIINNDANFLSNPLMTTFFQCPQHPVSGGALSSGKTDTGCDFRQWKIHPGLWRSVPWSEHHQVCHHTEYLQQNRRG